MDAVRKPYALLHLKVEQANGRVLLLLFFFRDGNLLLVLQLIALMLVIRKLFMPT